MKQRVLIFHPCLAPYRIDFFNKLNEKFEVFALFTAGQPEINSLAFNLKKVNQEANFCFKYYNKGFYFRRHLISFIYLRYFFIIKPKAVIASELGFNTIISIFFKYVFNYKLIVTVDDSLKMSKNYSTLRNLLRKFTYNFVDKIIVVNPKVKNYLTIIFPEQTSKFIYFPIIQNDVKLSKQIKRCDITNISHELDIKEKKVVLFVGRLEKVKSPMLLLKVYRKIVSSNPSISKLIIVGDGSMKEEMETYIDKHNLRDQIKLVGKKHGKDLYPYYKLAHIFVLPSNFEPFGAVVNEALIAGCYCIVSDIAGSSCLINKKNGTIFKSQNSEDLYNALKSGIENTSSSILNESKMDKTFNAYFKKVEEIL